MANDQGWFSGKTKISLTVPDRSAIQVRLLRFPQPLNNRAFCHHRGAAPQQYDRKAGIGPKKWPLASNLGHKWLIRLSKTLTGGNRIASFVMFKVAGGALGRPNPFIQLLLQRFGHRSGLDEADG
jgi:hypothetical protein